MPLHSELELAVHCKRCVVSHHSLRQTMRVGSRKRFTYPIHCSAILKFRIYLFGGVLIDLWFCVCCCFCFRIARVDSKVETSQSRLLHHLAHQAL